MKKRKYPRRALVAARKESTFPLKEGILVNSHNLENHKKALYKNHL